MQIGVSVSAGAEFVQDVAYAVRLQALGRLGFDTGLVLDNFGAGRAGLANLRAAPLDKIKIARNFIRTASGPASRSAAVVRAVVALAESLGMATTAQGAESREESMLIRKLGCSQIQGFFFGKPMPAEAARSLAAQSRAAPEPVPGFTRPPRHRLIRNGRIEIGGRSLPVRLRTISEGGATLECDLPVEPEARAILDLDEAGRLDAEARWCKSGRIGLRFDAPFKIGKLASRRLTAPA